MTVARDISDRDAIKDRDPPPDDGAAAHPRGSLPTAISLVARKPLPVRVTTETVPLAELVT